MDGQITMGAPVARAVEGGMLTDAARRFGAERPGDVRYATPADFAAAMRAVRERGAEARADLGTLRAEADGDDLVIIGQRGIPARPTHYAFGRLASEVGAPSGFLRELPCWIAADVMTDRLRAAGAKSAGLLFSRHADGVTLRAVTGPDYGRIWNADVAAAAADVADRAGFAAPVAFRSAARHAGLDHLASTPGSTATEHALPCAVANDREAFLFLVSYDAQIRVPGYDAPLFRGFFLENSEVGAAALRLTTFLLDGVCCNFNVWGARDVTEISLRHTSGVHSRTPQLYQAARALAATSAAEDEQKIVNAQRMLVADTTEKTIDRLFGMRLPGVTRTVAEAAVEVAKTTPRYGDPRSVWAVGNGLTEVSQRETHADDRAQIDRSAGKVFRMAF